MEEPRPDDRSLAAAANNAAWCGLVCRTHGVPSHADRLGWWAGGAPPAYHPDAVTLDPAAPSDAVAARLRERRGASVKDSFRRLDLRGHGYVRLLDAQWIHRDAPAATPAATPAGAMPPGWQRVTTPVGLATWSAVHGSGDLFRPALLDDPAVAVLLGSASGAADPAAADAAGAVLNRSDDGRGGEVVGVSNVFGPDAADGDPDAVASVWSAVVTAAAATYPGRPLVGWETDEDLAAAVAAGFTPVGPLTVWAR